MITYIPAREWVKASQRKPADGQEVLAIVGKSKFLDIATYDNQDRTWITNDMKKIHVSWWCELPIPPYASRTG